MGGEGGGPMGGEGGGLMGGMGGTVETPPPSALTVVPDIQVVFSIDEPGVVGTELEVSVPTGDRARVALEGWRAGMAWSETFFEFTSPAPGQSPPVQTFVLTCKVLKVETGPVKLSPSGSIEIVRDGCSGMKLTNGSTCTVSVRPRFSSGGRTNGYLDATATRAGTARLELRH